MTEGKEGGKWHDGGRGEKDKERTERGDSEREGRGGRVRAW